MKGIPVLESGFGWDTALRGAQKNLGVPRKLGGPKNSVEGYPKNFRCAQKKNPRVYNKIIVAEEKKKPKSQEFIATFKLKPNRFQLKSCFIEFLGPSGLVGTYTLHNICGNYSGCFWALAVLPELGWVRKTRFPSFQVSFATCWYHWHFIPLLGACWVQCVSFGRSPSWARA